MRSDIDERPTAADVTFEVVTWGRIYQNFQIEQPTENNNPCQSLFAEASNAYEVEYPFHTAIHQKESKMWRCLFESDKVLLHLEPNNHGRYAYDPG